MTQMTQVVEKTKGKMDGDSIDEILKVFVKTLKDFENALVNISQSTGDPKITGFSSRLGNENADRKYIQSQLRQLSENLNIRGFKNASKEDESYVSGLSHVNRLDTNQQQLSQLGNKHRGRPRGSRNLHRFVNKCE